MGKRKIQIEEYPKIKELYLDGLSSVEIGKCYGVAHNTILYILKKLGVKRRYCGEGNRIYSLDEKFFDNINSQEKAYILGLVFADGWINLRRASLGIGLNEDDKYLLEEISQMMKSDKPLYYQKPRNNGRACYVFTPSSRYMVNRLVKLGCTSNKSLKLKCFMIRFLCLLVVVEYFVLVVYNLLLCINKIGVSYDLKIVYPFL